jgi:type II secretion system protein J
MEWWSNRVMEKWSNARRNQYATAPVLRPSSPPILHYSNPPLLQSSTPPILQHPASPLLRFSTGCSGFTLIEILIAIVIFVTLLTTIYASYTGTFRVIGDTESQAEIYRMARIAMERIIEDLESLYIREAGSQNGSEESTDNLFQFLGEEKEIMGQRADTLRFLSSAHINLSGNNPGYGATQIGYYVKEDDDGENFVLYRTDNPLFKETYAPDEMSGGLVLCEGLVSVTFTYYGEDGQASNSWDSASEGTENKIPKAVSVTLELENSLNPEMPIIFTTGIALPMKQAYL